MASTPSSEKMPNGGSPPATAKGHGRPPMVASTAPSSMSALGKLEGDTVTQSSTQLDQSDPYSHLPPDEAAILKEQVNTVNAKVGFTTLYRYASRNDLLIIFIASVASLAGGAAIPLMTIIFGDLQGDFQDYFTGQMTYDGFMDEISDKVLFFIYLAIGQFVCIYVSTVGFIYTGEHITSKIRTHYLASCLRQNIGFFDKLGAGEVTTRITADTNQIQDGISEKVSVTINAFATFLTAFIIGFVKYWKLTLILLSTVVALTGTMGFGSSMMLKYTTPKTEAYAEGGSLADEVLSSIRNAVAFSSQDRLARRYDVHLVRAQRLGYKVSISFAFMVGGMMLVLYLNYALAFWMGSRFVIDGSTELSSVLTILLSVMIGAFSLGTVGPNIQAFTTAIGSAARIYSTIERQSPLDPGREDGIKLDKVEGTITLEHVKHIYPSRPDIVVMEDVSLTIPAGKTTALVGASGSGKSTIVGLVERFYKPVQGKVYLDGVDISTLNLRWLRQHVSLVSQEPTLFDTTIFENIRYGLIGTQWEHESREKQLELVHQSARKANAHDFVTSLPNGYETSVGARGFLLSGGQKQRIAIARAIVSDPKILLLDEATSALDTKSEGIVQAALDSASEGRTTISIAHRLSTIKEAHNIVVMAAGRIVEQGSHDELVAKRGAYYNLVNAQSILAVNELTTEEEEALDKEEEEMIRIRSKHSYTGVEDVERGLDGIVEDDEKVAVRLHRTTTSKSHKTVKSARSLSSVAIAHHKSGQLKGPRKYPFWTLVKLVASFNKEEWHIMLAGLLTTIVSGGGNPVQAVFFSKLIETLSRPVTPESVDGIRSDTSFWCWMYFMLAWTMFISNTAQNALLGFCAERLTRRVRDSAFRSFLRQDIGFFDREENAAGVLTSFLSTQATHVAGMSGATLGTILMVLSTLISAIIVGLILGWKLALVCIATIPLVVGSGFLRFWTLAHYERRARRVYEKSASFASEAVGAIRTVASLTREEDVGVIYRASLDRQLTDSLRSVLKSSALYAASQALMFLVFALGFWYGAKLIAQGEYTMFQFFVVFASVIFSAQSAGSVFSFAPDMGKAHEATHGLKELFDRKPTIDTWSDEGAPVSSMKGTIEFRDVHFRYPTRLEQPVLRGLNMDVRPGQYAALVGASGCGKSTTIALLERFYDPLSGGVYVDGQEISTLNINEYRNHIALVSQEPTLYQGTIRENLFLGAPGDVTDAQLESVCRQANIYDFVMSLPEGFDTIVGSKGSLLSGGQKQRIAIARALIRDPRILLLDEATSALDSESEHVVQAALDAASKGRTTLAVAHRLSTIQKADVIFVFDQGRVVEKGTHGELMKLNGRYAELVRLQQLEKSG